MPIPAPVFQEVIDYHNDSTCAYISKVRGLERGHKKYICKTTRYVTFQSLLPWRYKLHTSVEGFLFSRLDKFLLILVIRKLVCLFFHLYYMSNYHETLLTRCQRRTRDISYSARMRGSHSLAQANINRFF